MVSPWFAAGFLVCFLGLVFSGNSELDFQAPRGDAFTAFHYAYRDNNSFWFFVVGCALPYAGSYCEDRRWGLFPLERGRISLPWFVTARVVACGISGGLALCTALALFWILCVLGTETNIPAEPGWAASFDEVLPYMALVSQENMAAYLGLFLGAQFFHGAFWACLALAVSAFASRSYEVYAAPLIVAMILVQLGDMVGLPDMLNPCRLSTDVVLSGPLVTELAIDGLYGVGIAVAGWVFYGGLKRRWRRG